MASLKEMPGPTSLVGTQASVAVGLHNSCLVRRYSSGPDMFVAPCLWRDRVRNDGWHQMPSATGNASSAERSRPESPHRPFPKAPSWESSATDALDLSSCKFRTRIGNRPSAPLRRPPD